jgi:hypothetical protein
MRAHRNIFTRIAGIVLLVGAFGVITAARSEAALIVWLCNDASCSGGGDFTIADGSASDGDTTVGSVSFLIPGYADVDAGDLGTAATPVLTMNYTLTSAGFGLFGTPYIYAAQDDYTAFPGTATFAANNSLGGGTGSLFAGPSGTFAPGSGTEIIGCASIAPSACVGGSAAVPPAPYYLALGIVPASGSGGAATGDASVFVTPQQTVPDGGTTATLLGSILLGFGVLRRKLSA